MKINLIKAQRILSPTQISIAQYTINPYRGCPFGCLYCYVQKNKAIKKRNEQWGSFIDIKLNAIELLRQEIKNKDIKRVLLGSTVECYPPQENEYLLTRNIIEILNKNDIAVTILTKSILIERDLDIISKFKGNKIYLTINFDSERIKNIFEPNSSSIKDRLNTLKKITKLNIDNRIHIAPVIPYIQNIDSIFKLVEKHTKEISIELFNFKMGNWPKIRKILQRNFKKDKVHKISKVFKTKQNYISFINQLKDKINELRVVSKKKIILLFPRFKDYYRSDVVYD